MPKINLCFLWHMHQPFYKDLVTGEYRLPWVRLHALKDYYGMVKILEEFPGIHQTFNLVPSLLVQIEEYAEGAANDPFLRLALKPAEQLSLPEKEFVLRYFFQASELTIQRYPRYRELFELVRYCNTPRLGLEHFTTAMLRDLQVLSQLAWFDEEFQQSDAEIAGLIAKERGFSLADQRLVGKKQLELLRKVSDVYRGFAARGQIELSTTPFYHPILPLLCDSNIASESRPYVPLPTRFVHPEDAAEQMRRSVEYFQFQFGLTPAGLWPSEGSVSDKTLELAAQQGFRWIASDDAVLARTDPFSSPYQSHRWKQNGREIHVFFRDHRLSDLIGFVYSKMDPDEAAEHFLEEIRAVCRPLLEEGRDAVVPIILDGENAWENYAENGRPFLRALYSRLAEDPGIDALTMTEAMRAVPAEEINHIFPGSWIDANFDIWIGAEEDNAAWEHLAQARQKYDEVTKSLRGEFLPEESKRLAYEELLIAEGSDWCWWYGPEHSSPNRVDFDQLFRDHLANVYRLLNEPVPTALEEPLVKEHQFELHEPPDGLIQPVIDGTVTSPSEWLNAGRYRFHDAAGTMHSRLSLIQDLRYGSDEKNMYFRIDWREPAAELAPLEIRLQLRNRAGRRFHAAFSASRDGASMVNTDLPANAVAIASNTVCEMRISMEALQLKRGDSLFVNLDLYRDGVPIATLPAHGELELQWTMMAAYAV